MVPARCIRDQGGIKLGSMSSGRIFVGIGGWIYPPWRGVFYPKGLKHDHELEFASRAVTAIEINSTFYRLQSATSFEKWAAMVPDGFIFSLKASRFCTNRKNLREAGQGIDKFLGQGLTCLGDKLGPINWQLMPTKRFDPDEIREFLAMLPRERDGIPLRHALEVRHESFCVPEFVAIARKAKVACVFADKPEYPQIADCTADFVYARLQHAQEKEKLGYSRTSLDQWSKVAREWAAGKQPAGLNYVAKPAAKSAAKPRDVFVFFINGAKVRAPAAAQALLERLAPATRTAKRRPKAA
jgi:uncharacterized protein YecE (DUF72 family)